MWYHVAVAVGCRSDSDCSGQHSCVNRNCVPVCAPDGSSCGRAAVCYGANHRAVCECPPGLSGNPEVVCLFLGCRSDSECPPKQACINNECVNPCYERNPCKAPAECRVYNHHPTCTCPPGYVEDTPLTCKRKYFKGRIMNNKFKLMIICLLPLELQDLRVVYLVGSNWNTSCQNSFLVQGVRVFNNLPTKIFSGSTGYSFQSFKRQFPLIIFRDSVPSSENIAS